MYYLHFTMNKYIELKANMAYFSKYPEYVYVDLGVAG